MKKPNLSVNETPLRKEIPSSPYLRPHPSLCMRHMNGRAITHTPHEADAAIKTPDKHVGGWKRSPSC